MKKLVHRKKIPCIQSFTIKQNILSIFDYFERPRLDRAVARTRYILYTGTPLTAFFFAIIECVRRGGGSERVIFSLDGFEYLVRGL